MDLSHIKHLITRNKFEETFKRLGRMQLTRDHENESILLHARFISLDRDTRLGTISTQDAEIRRNTNCRDLLSLITLIEDDISSSRQALSQKAKTILLEASLDSDGQIIAANTKDGMIIQTDCKVLFQNGTAREEAKYQGALDVLCDWSLMREMKGRYKVTPEGFDLADKIEVAIIIDKFLIRIGDTLSSLPQILDKSSLPKKENKDIYKIVENELIKLDLVITHIKPNTNKTASGWGYYRIFPKGRQLLRKGKSSFSLFELEYQ